MTAPPPSPDLLASLSRELLLTVGADGTLLWTDDRTRWTLGADATRLRDLAAPGTEEKVDRLVAAAVEARTAVEWETVLVLDGVAVPVSFRGAPHDGGALLVGSFVGRDAGAQLEQMSATMNELSALHRETGRQQRELLRLNRELDESGRGLRALYAELDVQADSLRNASEIKSRFIANMSHELRTPINSILGLTQLLIARTDGALTAEQERQVSFIRKSAEVLAELVGDVLDLAKIEAGKTALRPVAFDVESTFSTLRGMLRPVHAGDDVALVFDPVPAEMPTLNTDEGKLAQILRNLVSNALKFTERGEVRVTARANGDNTVTFVVADTGVGIAPGDLERVFEEFTQIDNPVQRRVKGTGLGLSVSQRLAGLLGGRITAASEVGRGSVFSFTIPAVHPDVEAYAALTEQGLQLDPARAPVLVVEDDAQTMFLYEKYLSDSGFQVVPARGVDDARAVLARVRPAAVVLDVMLDGETSWSFLEEMKKNPATRDIPTLVVTVMDRENKARALGADEFFVKPMQREWLLNKLQLLASARGPVERVLVIDDDAVARYLVRRLLADTRYAVLEAADGAEGVRLARDERPDVIVLDFVLPSMTAFEVIDDLKCDPRTRAIPVIVSTSKTLDTNERARLAADTAAILSKAHLSREVAISRIREALAKAIPAGGASVTARAAGGERGRG
jgi:signal transduction histidine kinase/CheY-like chemotaxis protein